MSPEQALVITRAKDALSDGVSAERRARFETDLLTLARTCMPKDLEIAARRAAATTDPTGSGDLARSRKRPGPNETSP